MKNWIKDKYLDLQINLGTFYDINIRQRYNKYKYGQEDSEYRLGSLVHVWGVKSWDDLTGQDCNLYTMNDIDITYDEDTKIYMLGIETAYMFSDRSKECEYLRECLDAFSKYMDDNGLDKNDRYCLFMSQPSTSLQAESIEELYTNFRIFVEGYCTIYNQ